MDQAAKYPPVLSHHRVQAVSPVTLRRKVALVVTLPLPTLMVILATPARPDTGVMARVWLVPPASLVRTMFVPPLGTSVRLSEVAVIVSRSAGVAGSLTVKRTKRWVLFVVMDWSAMAEMAGGVSCGLLAAT